MPLYRSAGKFNWLTDTIKVAILKNTYTPSMNHLALSDVSGEEVSGSGYTAGGVALTGMSYGWDSVASRHILDADDLLIESVTFTNGRYAVIYADSGTASTSPLIGYVDLGADYTLSNGAFKVQWHTSGIFFVRLVE